MLSPVLAERGIGRGGQVDPADPAVGVVAEIDDVVVARAQIAEQRRARPGSRCRRPRSRRARGCSCRSTADLAGQADEREILADRDWRCRIQSSRGRLDDVVEAGVGVLLQPPERREIVLEAVVVAIAEQADAELLVLEQEAAEIGLERLDADADAVEVVAVGDVADVIVDEGFLHAEELIEAVGAACDGSTNSTRRSGDVDIIDVEARASADIRCPAA